MLISLCDRSTAREVQNIIYRNIFFVEANHGGFATNSLQPDFLLRSRPLLGEPGPPRLRPARPPPTRQRRGLLQRRGTEAQEYCVCIIMKQKFNYYSCEVF